MTTGVASAVAQLDALINDEHVEVRPNTVTVRARDNGVSKDRAMYWLDVVTVSGAYFKDDENETVTASRQEMEDRLLPLLPADEPLYVHGSV